MTFLDVRPECQGHVQPKAMQVSTCEELLAYLCLFKAIASATAEKYFAKNRKYIGKVTD